MTYIVLETQTNDGVTAIVPPVAYTDRNAAEAAFHLILASAATSAIEEHTAMLLTSDGRLVRQSECYRHPKAAQPEEPEVIDNGEEEGA